MLNTMEILKNQIKAVLNEMEENTQEDAKGYFTESEITRDTITAVIYAYMDLLENEMENAKYTYEKEESIFNQICIEIENFERGAIASEDDTTYEMELIDEFYQNDINNLMFRMFYGYDVDTSYKPLSYEGDSKYEPFNPNRAYFYYNGYGNLVSTDYNIIEADASDVVDWLLDNYSYIDIDNIDDGLYQLLELFTQLDFNNGYITDTQTYNDIYKMLFDLMEGLE